MDEDDEQWYEDERTFTQKIAPGTIGLDKKNPLFEMKLSDTLFLLRAENRLFQIGTIRIRRLS